MKDKTNFLSSPHSGVAFNRANKKHLIRCDLTNFDEINSVIRDLQVEIAQHFFFQSFIIDIASCYRPLCG